MAARRPAQTDVAALFAALDREDLETVLTAAAARHEDVATALRLAAASHAGDLGELRAAIDGRLRTRRYLDYYQSSSWATEAAPVVDAIEEAAASPSAELVALIERAIGHVVKVILRADDSNGMIGTLIDELLQIHAEVCDAYVADPRKLAAWMIRFDFEDQDFFFADPVRYAAALGDAGLAEYRKEVDRRSRATEPPFAVRQAMERLAVLDGDIDAVIQLYGGDLSGPYHFIRVAEAMNELGRDDDVLLWSNRGIAETDGWQVAQLYDLAAMVHARRSDTAALLALRKDQHLRMASAATYKLLREAAELNDAWSSEQPAARSILAERNLGALVDVFLDDGEPETAWRVTADNPDWDPGPMRWSALAKAREPSFPADALVVYLRLADQELETTGRAAYQRAVAILQKAARAAEAAEQTSAFDDHMAALRERNRRRPTLVELLNRARLP